MNGIREQTRRTELMPAPVPFTASLNMSALFLPCGKTCEFTWLRTNGKSPEMSPKSAPKAKAGIKRPRCGFRKGKRSRYGPTNNRTNSRGEGLFFDMEYEPRETAAPQTSEIQG